MYRLEGEKGRGQSYKYQIAIKEVLIFGFGISPAKNTRISKAQYSKLIKNARRLMKNMRVHHYQIIKIMITNGIAFYTAGFQSQSSSQ